MTSPQHLSPISPLPDAEAQCLALADLIRPDLTPETALVGIFSGGAWIAERLVQLLGLPEEAGMIDISFYRDDFAEKGLHPQVRPTQIPFDVNDRRLILVDDVLYTGRTTRAALNELFDYGRPASIHLAVLADRGCRELPVAPNYCVWNLELPRSTGLILSRGDDGHLFWELEDHA
ncbi:bifunctional pyr operon transcriptional regulator/uracil phosphoribosyltransferase [Betaproteobacteria bacterium]|nr:bifunctional pyr operon transcriptional regulator/uracil phosphoribosyltransferase [Betaproteobacteria bacterium]GHU39845.1 bifunctional pyr operon transcriptional regulator/uracil phosphoribosyltransferase [Betaproteobacteria bacterium]